MKKKFYYPDNLTAENLFLFWNLKDSLIILGLLILSIVSLCFLHIWAFAAFLVFYAIISAKIDNGYSISKVAVLYIRFYITDNLILKWR